MTAKGSSKRCCCNGCEKQPEIFTSTGTDVTLSQRWQRYCCSCIPQYICVWVNEDASNSVSASASDSTGLPDATIVMKLYCPDSPEGAEQALYGPISQGGKVAIGHELFDITIHFVVTDEVCYLCIRSTDLGIDDNTPGACVVIGSTERASPNYFCKRLSTTDDPMLNTTDRDLGDAGFGVGT